MRRFAEQVQDNAFYEGILTDPQANVSPTQAYSDTEQEAVEVVPAPLQYYNSIIVKQQPEFIEADCNEITFYNNGAATMNINGISFAPGTGIAFDGKAGEIDVTKYQLSFTGTGVQSAVVIRKLYV